MLVYSIQQNKAGVRLVMVSTNSQGLDFKGMSYPLDHRAEDDRKDVRISGQWLTRPFLVTNQSWESQLKGLLRLMTVCSKRNNTLALIWQKNKPVFIIEVAGSLVHRVRHRWICNCYPESSQHLAWFSLCYNTTCLSLWLFSIAYMLLNSIVSAFLTVSSPHCLPTQVYPQIN